MKSEIEKYNPCDEALEYRRKFKTFKEAWQKCEMGDWMLWISAKAGVDERKLFLAKGLCAQLSVPYMEDQRSVDAVNAAIAYGRGEIGYGELEKTNSAACAAAYDACDAAAAAYYAAAAADYASDTYAYVSPAPASAKAAHCAGNSMAEALKQCADICREVLTEEILKKINQ